ncbi:MAG TPA: hypothetical protein VKD90_19445 [Gemmataceae bacterium]|nr:hypothetical protein [Gemmataceae bacterium]
MKKLIALPVLTAVALLLIPDPGQACFRKRRPTPVVWVQPCPVVYQPAVVATVPAEPVQYFVSPKGRTYRFTVSREPRFEFERKAVFPPTAAPPGPDDFTGEDRGKAKTSISGGPTTTFASLGALLDDVVGNFPDDQMRHRTPPLKRDFDFDRVAEEDRNVTVPAWLYAVKKEQNDNDYHLIVGTDPAAEPVRYMNMEITGLPLGGVHREALKAPRQALKDYLQAHHHTVTTSTGYFRFEDPVPVRITGSLFYDIDHAPGVVGSFKEPKRVPATAWEVHPVTEIVFEP